MESQRAMPSVCDERRHMAINPGIPHLSSIVVIVIAIIILIILVR